MAESAILLVQTYRAFLEGMLVFGIALLATGVIAGALLRRIVHAWVPFAKQVPPEQQEMPVRVSYACVNFLAWMLALVFASAVADLPSVANFLVILSGAVLVGPAAIIVTGLIVYSFSKEGNRLIAGLTGYVYLRLNQGRTRTGLREFDLGDGSLGKVSRISLLQTTFKLTDGGTVTRQNAELMNKWFGMGAKIQ